MTRSILFVGMLIGGLLLIGCGGGSESASTTTGARSTWTVTVADNLTQSEHRVIDERRGTYRGVGLLDTKDTVIRRLGQPKQQGHVTIVPPGAPLGTAVQPWTCRLTSHHVDPFVLLYQRVSFTTDPPAGLRIAPDRKSSPAPYTADLGRVCNVFIADPGAATRTGVAIGEPLAEARSAYRGLACRTLDQGSDELLLMPFCAGRLARHRYIQFGGDPIESIMLNWNAEPGVPAPQIG